MTPAEVVANLRVFNDWRRGELDDLSMPDPREIGEAIDAAVEMVERFEAAEKERDALRAEVETTENDAAHQKTLAESALRVSEGWEEKCNALRAKIAAMEQPESGFRERCTPAAPAGGSNRFPLYTLPGTKGE